MQIAIVGIFFSHAGNCADVSHNTMFPQSMEVAYYLSMICS